MTSSVSIESPIEYFPEWGSLKRFDFTVGFAMQSCSVPVSYFWICGALLVISFSELLGGISIRLPFHFVDAFLCCAEAF